jgi:tripartite-type tricarboxylate transporter receptor subunit TctC
MKRVFFHCLAAGALLLAASGIQAQPYPSKIIRMVVPFPPGGATDVVARVVSAGLAESLGQTIVVENRVGAGGVIGTDAVAKSPPDGYTLLAVFDNFTSNPSLFKNVGSDPVRDFTPIAQLVRSAQILVVPASSGITKLEELVKRAKERGNALNYATAGPGTSSHLAMELFKQTAGIEPTAIHYKGGSPAMTALYGAQVEMMIVTLGIGMPGVKAGKMNALGVTSTGPSKLMPDVPPVSATYPGFDTQSWVGFVGPAGMPAEVVATLNGHIGKALEKADIRQRLESQGYEIVGGRPEVLGELVKRETARWSKLIRERGITIE